MGKRVKIVFLSIGLSVFTCFGKLPESLSPTEQDRKAFLNEADDFIDGLPEGLQDHQCDAVLHALRGDSGELAEIRQSRNGSPEYPQMVKVDEFEGDGPVRGIRMRLYTPEIHDGGILPLLVYFHGGGWTFGGLNSCAAFCGSLASTGKVAVLAVDYGLAPENPYPSGLMDCVSAVEYAMAHAAEWGSDGNMVSVGGDSSGGNLALATALYMNDSQGSDKLRSVVLFYPVVKAYVDKSDSWRRYSRGYGLDSRLMEAFNEAYLHASIEDPESVADAHDELVSPADADESKLGSLPPLLIVGAERDILYDQGKEFADAQIKMGHKTTHVTFPGAVHLFITVYGQPTAFSKAVALTESFLADTF